MDRRPASYEEFWPFYVSQHMKPATRALHVLGIVWGLGFVGAGLLLAPFWILLSAPASYFLAWIGHFFVEKNRPATFTYPLWSIRGDLRMCRLILLGRMAAELERASRLYPKAS